MERDLLRWHIDERFKAEFFRLPDTKRLVAALPVMLAIISNIKKSLAMMLA